MKTIEIAIREWSHLVITRDPRNVNVVAARLLQQFQDAGDSSRKRPYHDAGCSPDRSFVQ